MITLNIKDRSNLLPALRRAHAESVTVEFIEFRHYQATSSDRTKFYDVTFQVSDEDGSKTACCTCLAGQGRRAGQACKHVALALEAHLEYAAALYRAEQKLQFQTLQLAYEAASRMEAYLSASNSAVAA